MNIFGLSHDQPIAIRRNRTVATIGIPARSAMVEVINSISDSNWPAVFEAQHKPAEAGFFPKDSANIPLHCAGMTPATNGVLLIESPGGSARSRTL